MCLKRCELLCRLENLTMGNGVVSEHQLHQTGVKLGDLQEWVLQNAHLGSFSGVRRSCHMSTVE